MREIMLFVIVLAALSAGSSVSVSSGSAGGQQWWSLNATDDSVFDEYRTASIFLKHVELDENRIHSCYEYKVIKDKNLLILHDTFCYPSIIVTGMRKSGTSAMYNLLASLPYANIAAAQMNCMFAPFSPHESIVQYFSSLPKRVAYGKVVIDGCTDLESNIRARTLLRNPNTLYLVMVRDFTDWTWSMYNSFCSSIFDADCDPSGDLAIKPNTHKRSVQHLLDIASRANTESRHIVDSPLEFDDLCQQAAHHHVRAYVRHLWGAVPPESTLLIASEDLWHAPEKVWVRLAAVIGLPPPPKLHHFLADFSKYRYNAQGIHSSKGVARETIPAEKVRLGRYAASNHKRVGNSTRQIIGSCWREDCLWAAVLTNHTYAACAMDLSSLLQLLYRQLPDLPLLIDQLPDLLVGPPLADRLAADKELISEGSTSTEAMGATISDGSDGWDSSTVGVMAATGEREESKSLKKLAIRYLSHHQQLLLATTALSINPSSTADEGAHIVAAHSENNNNINNNSLKDTDSISDLPSPFLVEKISLCRHFFTQQVLPHAALHHEFSSSAPKSSKGSVLRTIKTESDGANYALGGVLVLALTQAESSFIRSRLFYASGYGNIVEMDETVVAALKRQAPTAGSSPGAVDISVFNHSMLVINGILKSATATASARGTGAAGGESYTSTVDICSRYTPAVVITTPDNVELVNIGREHQAMYLKLKYGGDCPSVDGKGVQSRRVFDKVVVVMADAVTYIWELYRKVNGNKGDLSHDDVIFFNWDHWESSALNLLKSLAVTSPAGMWKAGHSELIAGMFPVLTNDTLLEAAFRLNAERIKGERFSGRGERGGDGGNGDGSAVGEGSALYESVFSLNNQQLLFVRAEDLMYADSEMHIFRSITTFIADSLRAEVHNAFASKSSAAADPSAFDVFRIVGESSSALRWNETNSGDMNDASSSSVSSSPSSSYTSNAPSSLSVMQCAAALSNVDSAKGFDYLKKQHALTLAYASSDLVCKLLLDEYKSDLLQRLSVQLRYGNGLRCEDEESLRARSVRLCHMRYQPRTYSPVTKIPALLITGRDRPTVLGTRLLIEHSTGIYTGAPKTDNSLTKIFPGEQFCGQRMSALHTYSSDATVQIMKDGKSLIGWGTADRAANKKCKKGAVRGIKRAALIVRDPFYAVWIAYHRWVFTSDPSNQGKPPRTLPLSMNYRIANASANATHEQLLGIARSYRRALLFVDSAFDQLNEKVNGEDEVLIVSYEALINPQIIDDSKDSDEKDDEEDGENTGAAGSAGSDREERPQTGNEEEEGEEEVVQEEDDDAEDDESRFPRLLAARRLLEFLGYPDVTTERLSCAYSFLDSKQIARHVLQMNAFFLPRPSLLCKMNTIFNEVLTPNRFDFVRLYDDVLCEELEEEG